MHLRVGGDIAALSVWQLESTSPVVARPTPDHLKSDDEDDALFGHVRAGSLWISRGRHNAPGDGD
eukprot:COSAG01_NODE_3184_length_6446_cov_3.562155_3_plen_65_part_00